MSNGAATVTVTATATDDLSGVYYIQVRFTSPSGLVYGANLNRDSNGNLPAQATLNIPALAANGDYKAWIYLSDNLGNGRYYTTEDLQALNMPTLLQVNSQ